MKNEVTLQIGDTKYKIINIPQTITVLAVGFLFGNLLFLPMIAWLGPFIKPDFQESVNTIAGLFKDGMLLILGYYFRDKAIKKVDEDV